MEKVIKKPIFKCVRLLCCACFKTCLFTSFQFQVTQFHLFNQNHWRIGIFIGYCINTTFDDRCHVLDALPSLRGNALPRHEWGLKMCIYTITSLYTRIKLIWAQFVCSDVVISANQIVSWTIKLDWYKKRHELWRHKTSPVTGPNSCIDSFWKFPIGKTVIQDVWPADIDLLVSANLHLPTSYTLL